MNLNWMSWWHLSVFFLFFYLIFSSFPCFGIMGFFRWFWWGEVYFWIPGLMLSNRCWESFHLCKYIDTYDFIDRPAYSALSSVIPYSKYYVVDSWHHSPATGPAPRTPQSRIKRRSLLIENLSRGRSWHHRCYFEMSIDVDLVRYYTCYGTWGYSRDIYFRLCTNIVIVLFVVQVQARVRKNRIEYCTFTWDEMKNPHYHEEGEGESALKENSQ